MSQRSNANGTRKEGNNDRFANAIIIVIVVIIVAFVAIAMAMGS